MTFNPLDLCDTSLGLRSVASEHATTRVIEDFTVEIKRTLKVSSLRVLFYKI